MKPFILFSLCLLLILSVSCKKETSTANSSDYLIFGHFYGMCGGEQCVEIFKLDNCRLYEDSRDIYPNRDTFYVGAYSQLSNQQFNAVEDLMDFFPQDLLNESDTVIGMPDAGDWGGFYIEYNFNGTRRFWILDKMKTNVPSQYHAFIDKLNEKISLLQ